MIFAPFQASSHLVTPNTSKLLDKIVPLFQVASLCLACLDISFNIAGLLIHLLQQQSCQKKMTYKQNNED